MNTTTIKCGNCKGTHETANAVRACYGVTAKPAAPAQAGTTSTSTVVPATEKQREFATRLYQDKALPVAGSTGYEAILLERADDIVSGKAVSKKEASAVIDYLLGLPRQETKPAGAIKKAASEDPLTGIAATEGMHKIGDEIFKVQKAVHGSGHLYAKKLFLDEPDCGGCANGEPCGAGCKWIVRFEYAPGALKRLSAATQMSLEEAKEFGVLYGTCCVCGRTLTNEESIAAGIGPVCAGRFS